MKKMLSKRYGEISGDAICREPDTDLTFRLVNDGEAFRLIVWDKESNEKRPRIDFMGSEAFIYDNRYVYVVEEERKENVEISKETVDEIMSTWRQQ